MEGGDVPSLLQDTVLSRDVTVGQWKLPGILAVPPSSSAMVVFAHGSGSSRKSLRNQQVARALQDAGIGTLLFDLLHPDEEEANNRALVFDIGVLSARLADAVEWVDNAIGATSLGLFGASTGAAAALCAAAKLAGRIDAVVSRGGRPDLAGSALAQVHAPTLLIVGGRDGPVIEYNQAALKQLKAISSLKIIPGATHLFSEPGAMEQVTKLAIGWFETYLTPAPV